MNEELKRYDLIVEYVNRAKIARHQQDEVAERRHLKDAQELIALSLKAEK